MSWLVRLTSASPCGRGADIQGDNLQYNESVVSLDYHLDRREGANKCLAHIMPGVTGYRYPYNVAGPLCQDGDQECMVQKFSADVAAWDKVTHYVMYCSAFDEDKRAAARKKGQCRD
jgi:hypothetical protein